MLVLTRKIGDVIAIGDNIKIIVMAIKGKQVRLGIQADKNTVVHREEIYQKIKQETQAAMQSSVQATQSAQNILRTAASGSKVDVSQQKQEFVTKPISEIAQGLLDAHTTVSPDTEKKPQTTPTSVKIQNKPRVKVQKSEHK